MNNTGYMFNNQKELLELQAGVFGYLQRDIDKLLDKHYLDAEFMNFSQSNKDTGYSWIYLKVYYIWYDDTDDELGHYDELKVAYRLSKSLYTRDTNAMYVIDTMAGLNGKQDKLSNVDLVKLRILYSIFHIIKCIDNDCVPLDFAGTKKWIIVRQKDDGSITWTKEDHSPDY